MFACCVNAQASEQAEVVRTQKVFGDGDQNGASNELFAGFNMGGKSPLPPPPFPPEMSPRQQKAMRFQKADPVDETSSGSSGMLNCDIDGPDSRQSTAHSRGDKPTRFCRYDPDAMPTRQVSFEPGQQVGYQGFSGVMVRQISPRESDQGLQAVVISIPGLGDKQVSTTDLANEDHVARRSRKELQMHGMSKEEKLQAQVREFTSHAIQGTRVDLIDEENRLLSQSLFRMDQQMTMVSLRRALGDEQTFRIRDLKSVIKGEQFKKRVPKLAHLASQCLALEFATDPDRLQCLFFTDSGERDDFHLSMKVVRTMSSNSQQ